MRQYYFVAVIDEKGKPTELLTLPSSRGPVLLGFINHANFHAALNAARLYVKSYLKSVGKTESKLSVGTMSFKAPSPNALRSILEDTDLVRFESTLVLEGEPLFSQVFAE